ncbi:2'-5' RNA ligase family protein [Halosimplex sp. TS25]|uniref:2'-5' RNA ligase family protein n=1 Tax=Halosimplex rarum TaxID=3396619 RepID=UPI0039E9EB6F
MGGIVSLLDERATEKILAVRQRLDEELGVQTPFRNHYPHFSYQVAARYDAEQLSEAIDGLASGRDPFVVRTNGIGVFSDSEPLIVYVPVIRDADLSRFHSRVWDEGKSAGTDLQDYYSPRRWTPHITLAPVDRAKLPSVMELLSEYSFYWDVQIENVAAITGDAPHRKVEHRTPLGGDAGSAQG